MLVVVVLVVAVLVVAIINYYYSLHPSKKKKKKTCVQFQLTSKSPTNDYWGLHIIHYSKLLVLVQFSNF